MQTAISYRCLLIAANDFLTKLVGQWYPPPAEESMHGAALHERSVDKTGAENDGQDM